MILNISFEWTPMSYDIWTLLKIIVLIGAYTGVIIAYKAKPLDSFADFVAYLGLISLVFFLAYFLINV